MVKQAAKRNLSGIQVIKTFQLLFNGDYTMAELIDKLNANEPDYVFNNSVISKYINTCRFYGIEIPKVNNVYHVSHIPFGLSISTEDINLFDRLAFIIEKNMSLKNIKIFDKFVKKINRFSDKNIVSMNKNTIALCVELFEKAVAKRQKVKLMLKNNDIIECIPLQITESGDKKYFKIYTKRERLIDLQRLSGVEVLNDKFINTFGGEQSVIFRLSGPLAKRYEAREDESVTINNDGSIDVVNRSEPKEVLFSRLMRYDTLCEIMSPKSYRTEFQNMICDTIKNYEN